MRSLFDGPQSPSKTEVKIEEDIHFLERFKQNIFGEKSKF